MPEPRLETKETDTPGTTTSSSSYRVITYRSSTTKSIARRPRRHWHHAEPAEKDGRHQQADRPERIWHSDFVTRSVLNRQRLWQILTAVPLDIAPPLDRGETGLRTPENFRLTYSAIMAAIPIPTRENAGTILAIRDNYLRNHIENEFKFCTALANLLGIRWVEKKRIDDGKAWFAAMYALGDVLRAFIEKNGWTSGAIQANLSFGSGADDSLLFATDDDRALGLFASPLVEWLSDRTSRMNFSKSAHVKQSFLELKKRGGLSFLNDQFQEDLTHRLDIETATKELRKPMLERPDTTRIIEREGYSVGEPPLRGDTSCDAELREVLEDLRLLVYIFEQEVAESTDPQKKHLAMQDILHLRQKCQYSLLCMEEAAGLIEITRLAIMVFSLGGAYPLGDSRPLKTLATKLGTILDATFKSSDDELPNPHLLLWATVLGAIAGFPGEQHVYGQRLRLISVKTKTYFWREVRAIMGRFAWMHVACEKAGRKVWMDALAQTEDSDGPVDFDSMQSPYSDWSTGSEGSPGLTTH